jgi:DNA repair protein RecO (recombination protein O)
MKTRGTIIRRTALTETSLIVHWCCEEHGIVKTVAKGARRPKSPFAGKLDLFYRCEAEIHPARSGDLHILREVALLQPRLGLRRSYLQTLAAAHFVKLVERVSEPETPLPEISGLLERALDYLDGAEISWRAVERFETRLASILGIGRHDAPAIHSLAELFGTMPPQRAELAARLEQRAK